ncbi:hypothetical protein OFN94_39655, partial [Escherichia coli]|nr:hypothetical protein [Escherichia coli]
MQEISVPPGWVKGTQSITLSAIDQTGDGAPYGIGVNSVTVGTPADYYKTVMYFSREHHDGTTFHPSQAAVVAGE